MAEATSPGAFIAAAPADPVELTREGFRFRTETVDTAVLAELAMASRNPFLTPEWLTAWWEAFGPPGQAASVVRCEAADGRLVTVLPVYLWRRRPVRILRFIGHGPSDLLMPPVAPSAVAADAADALRAYLAASRAQWDLFIGEQIPATAPLAGCLGATVVRREGSPSLDVRGTWDDYLASLSANLRQQIRRRGRNLARAHAVRFRLTTSPDVLQHDLDVLFRLHRLRWGAASGKLHSRRAFHREFASVALERGWLRLWTLELDDRPVAVWYGIRFAGVDTYYLSARDPSLERESIGLVLLAHSIREAYNDGSSEYRFGRGGETYKYRLATRDDALETFMLAKGIRGITAMRAGLAARWLPRRPLDAVRRIAGD
jgi:CelD/BcsL family acetyltransferase involved in cellulose biosynthesis